MDHAGRGRGAAGRRQRVRGVRGDQRSTTRTRPLLRPTGIPGNISTSLANLMQLSPLPGVRAPGFTLTDQRGHTMSLASLRGKVVVLEFMDPHCTDICPIVSQEFVDAYHELGANAGKVVFAAINVNQYHASVADMAAYLGPAPADHDPGLAFLHRPPAGPEDRVARLQHPGRGAQPERRHHPHLGGVLHRLPGRGALPGHAHGGPHGQRDRVPAARPDSRLGRRDRPARRGHGPLSAPAHGYRYLTSATLP